MKTYRGDRTIDGLEVTVDGNSLDQKFDLKVVSGDGFEWGYEGASPSQLALAILADDKGNEYALANYELFMREIVANFNNEWEMTAADIDEALENIGAKA
jgi:hypothetical protein